MAEHILKDTHNPKLNILECDRNTAKEKRWYIQAPRSPTLKTKDDHSLN